MAENRIVAIMLRKAKIRPIELYPIKNNGIFKISETVPTGHFSR